MESRKNSAYVRIAPRPVSTHQIQTITLPLTQIVIFRIPDNQLSNANLTSVVNYQNTNTFLSNLKFEKDISVEEEMQFSKEISEKQKTLRNPKLECTPDEGSSINSIKQFNKNLKRSKPNINTKNSVVEIRNVPIHVNQQPLGLVSVPFSEDSKEYNLTEPLDQSSEESNNVYDDHAKPSHSIGSKSTLPHMVLQPILINNETENIRIHNVRSCERPNDSMSNIGLGRLVDSSKQDNLKKRQYKNQKSPSKKDISNKQKKLNTREKYQNNEDQISHQSLNETSEKFVFKKQHEALKDLLEKEPMKNQKVEYATDEGSSINSIKQFNKNRKRPKPIINASNSVVEINVPIQVNQQPLGLVSVPFNEDSKQYDPTEPLDQSSEANKNTLPSYDPTDNDVDYRRRSNDSSIKIEPEYKLYQKFSD